MKTQNNSDRFHPYKTEAKRTIMHNQNRTLSNNRKPDYECPLPPYNGPYPKIDLQKARNRLYTDVCSRDSFNNIITYLKPKLGLPPRRLIYPTVIMQRCLHPQPDHWHLDYDSVFNPSLFVKELESIHNLPLTTDHSVNSNKDNDESCDVDQIEQLDPSKEKAVEKDLEKNEEEYDTKDCNIFQNNSEYVQLIKCDFCDEMSKDEKILTVHLKESRHLSASSYYAKRISTGKTSMELLAVKESLAITLDSCEADDIIVCPSCFHIFSDIFSCGKHYQRYHDGGKRKYTICKIMKRQTVRLPIEPECVKCSRKFDSHPSLHQHWKNLPSHLPYNTELEEGCFMRFACMSCEKVSGGTLVEIKNHALNCRMKRPGRLTVLLLVYSIKTPEDRNVRTLLPFAEQFQDK